MSCMECKYCRTEMSDEHTMEGGHPECVAEKNARRNGGRCIKCNGPIDGGIVYHSWCSEYSKYEPPSG